MNAEPYRQVMVDALRDFVEREFNRHNPSSQFCWRPPEHAVSGPIAALLDALDAGGYEIKIKGGDPSKPESLGPLS